MPRGKVCVSFVTLLASDDKVDMWLVLWTLLYVSCAEVAYSAYRLLLLLTQNKKRHWFDE
jgi:hypothetical protein